MDFCLHSQCSSFWHGAWVQENFMSTLEKVSRNFLLTVAGGMEPSYRIRYRPTASFGEGYRYVDVIGSNITSFTITGLNMATDYTVSIMSFNKLGSSKYLPDTLRAKTSSEYWLETCNPLYWHGLYSLFSLPHIVRVITLRWMQFVGHVVNVGKAKSCWNLKVEFTWCT